jgi:hypothetical protein
MASILATFDISRRAEDIDTDFGHYTTGFIVSVLYNLQRLMFITRISSTDLRSLSNAPLSHARPKLSAWSFHRPMKYWTHKIIKLPYTSGIGITIGEPLGKSGVKGYFHNNMYRTCVACILSLM